MQKFIFIYFSRFVKLGFSTCLSCFLQNSSPKFLKSNIKALCLLFRNVSMSFFSFSTKYSPSLQPFLMYSIIDSSTWSSFLGKITSDYSSAIKLLSSSKAVLSLLSSSRSSSILLELMCFLQNSS